MRLLPWRPHRGPRGRAPLRISRLLPLLAAAAAAACLTCASLAATPALGGSAAPPDFHWGVATSGFQHEGYAADSNWARYVQAGADIANPVGNTVDFFHRYASDVALAAGMGVNTFRFSVEWARTEPQQGALNATALAFYDAVVGAVRSHGMTPMITLDHWVYPGWMYEQGGWTSSNMVTNWLSHCRTVVSRYAGLGVLWITINEATEYMTNENTFQGYNVFQTAEMQYNMVQAHKQAYALIHQLDPGTLVTSNFPYEPPPLAAYNDLQFLDQIEGYLDFIGIDYYVRGCFGPARAD